MSAHDTVEDPVRAGLAWFYGEMAGIEGRTEGTTSLASCNCDLGLEAAECARRWIAKVGERPAPGAGS